MLWWALSIVCLLSFGAFCRFGGFREVAATYLAGSSVILFNFCTFAIPGVLLGLSCLFGYFAVTSDMPVPPKVSPTVQLGGAHSDEAPAAGTPPREPGQNKRPIQSTVAPEPPPVTVTFRTNIVSAGNGDPIHGAKIALGHERDVSDEGGKVELQLPQKPGNDEVIRVSHTDYVSSVFRYDNMSARTEIRLEPKYRLLVAEFGPQDHPLNTSIRPAAEEQLTKCREIELMSGSKRNEIVEQLFQYQEGRSLYAKDTLAKVGNFLGATHGVFGTINTEDSGVVEFNCVLVHLETAMQIATASVRFDDESHADYASQLLMDQLLAKLTQVKIMSPLNGATVPRKTHVNGYGLFLPASWTLWISIMPLDNSRHYPQMRLTVEADGWWTAPGVQIGNDDPNASNPDFAVYAVLTDPSATKRIVDYHEKIKALPESNDGLNLASWGEDHCKILDSIEVTPPDR